MKMTLNLCHQKLNQYKRKKGWNEETHQHTMTTATQSKILSDTTNKPIAIDGIENRSARAALLREAGMTVAMRRNMTRHGWGVEDDGAGLLDRVKEVGTTVGKQAGRKHRSRSRWWEREREKKQADRGQEGSPEGTAGEIKRTLEH